AEGGGRLLEAKRLGPFDPLLAVLPDFLLPDGDPALHFVHKPMGGFEGGGAVATGDSDEKARLADLEAAGAVEDGAVLEAEALTGLLRPLAHDLLRHPRVGLVDEVVHAAALVVVADDSEEEVDRARRRGGDGG